LNNSTIIKYWVEKSVFCALEANNKKVSLSAWTAAWLSWLARTCCDLLEVLGLWVQGGGEAEIGLST
jgi:hypothetical protein